MKPKRIPNIVEFVTDPQLLGLSISEAQEALLRSIYGLPLIDHQLDLYRQCTGRQDYSPHGFSEVTVLCGARAGKDSRIACPIASYEACFGGHEKSLAKGERGIIPLVAQDQRATRIARDYVVSHFQGLLKSRLEEEPLASEIRLKDRLSVVCFLAPRVRSGAGPFPPPSWTRWPSFAWRARRTATSRSRPPSGAA